MNKKNVLVFILLNIAITSPIFAQSRLKFADYLFEENDFYRAISVYKEIMFYSEDDKIKNRCLLQIARSYHFSNRYETSIRYFDKLLNMHNLSDWYTSLVYRYMGLNYYSLHVLSTAENYLKRASLNDTTGYSKLYLALIEAEKNEWKKSSEIYRQVYLDFPDSRIGMHSLDLSEKVLKGINIPQKSTALATILSTMIPGSGQIYTKHLYDGLQAFFLVGSFSFASYLAYRYDEEMNTNYVSTYLSIAITSIFHLANIIGAKRTAQYYNLQQKKNFLDQIRKETFNSK